MDNFEQDFAKSVKLEAVPISPARPSSNIYIYILLGLIIVALSVALILSLIKISALESELNFYDNLGAPYEEELDDDLED